MRHNIELIGPFDVQKYWEDCRPLITEIIDDLGLRFKYDEHHVWGWLLQCRMQLWISTLDGEFAGFQITETVQYPKALVQCHFMSSVVPRFRHVLDLKEALGVVEQDAKMRGIQAIQASGRLGWIKQLKGQGYSHQHFTATKVLRNETTH